MTTQQIIWTGNEYEIADDRNSEIPDWPIQDAGARWHREEFPGQRVHFDRQNVYFGIAVEEISREKLKTLTFLNEADQAEDMFFDPNAPVFFASGRFFLATSSNG